jgi:hypothetical protein
MTILLIGIGILGTVIGLFYLKDRLENPTLARIAHSELMMRFTVIAIAMIAFGSLLVLNKLLS